MGRNLEDQMRLSLRGILSKQMSRGGDKHRIMASFINDESGFPLTGLKRSDTSIVDMEGEEFEQISAIVPQIWETVTTSSQALEFLSETSQEEVNHLTIGYKKKGEGQPHLEMMITRLDELFISSVFHAKK
jgi:hypothetical protein